MQIVSGLEIINLKFKVLECLKCCNAQSIMDIFCNMNLKTKFGEREKDCHFLVIKTLGEL